METLLVFAALLEGLDFRLVATSHRKAVYRKDGVVISVLSDGTWAVENGPTGQGTEPLFVYGSSL